MGFADDDHSGNLKHCKLEETESIGSGDHKNNIQETDSWLVSPKIDGEIKESKIKIEEKSLSAAKTSSGKGCTSTDHHDGQAADIKNLQASHVNENDAPRAPETLTIYACSLCGKAFSSRHAMAGHISAYHRFKMRIHDAIDDLSTTRDQQIASRGDNSALVGDDRTHYTCKICFKNFPSAQALGF